MGGLDRRLHARQLLLPEIGERGQVLLCAARVHIADGADPRAAEIAGEYLRRAGLQVSHAPSPARVHATSSSPSSAVLVCEAAVPAPDAIRALAGRPELEEAAAALAGAFAAVEAIKSALGLPHPGALPAALSLTGESIP